MMESAFKRQWVQERLQQVLDRAGDAVDGSEAVFLGDETSHMRLAESDIIEADHITEGRVFVRVLRSGAQARAVTTDLTDEGLKACTQLALDRLGPPLSGDEAHELPMPGIVAEPSEHALHPATARLNSQEKAQWLAPALQAHRKDGLALAGRFHTGLTSMGVRSSRGVDAYHQGSWTNLSLSALERPAGHGASSFRAYFNAHIDAATVDRVQEEVRLECHQAANPVEIDPGAYDVVLAPAAVAELVEWFGSIAFSSRAMDDGMSFVSGQVGERVTGNAISMYDDASMPHGVGVPMAFDAEGQGKQRVSLVEQGVARGVVHNCKTGRRHGCGSTGHAQLPSGFADSGSKPGHLHFGHGTASLDDLLGQLKRGLFITRLHYVNGMIDPRRAVMTGLTRDAAFLVDEGRIGRAISPLRFTDSMLEAFSRVPGLSGISRHSEAHGSWFGSQTCTVAPYVLIPGLKFTSGR